MKKDGLIDILIGFLFFCYGIYVFSFNNLSSFVTTLKASPLFMASLYSFAYILLVLLGLTMYLLSKSREESHEEKGRRNNFLVSLLLFITFFFFTFWLVILPFKIYLFGIFLHTMILACFIISLFFLLGYANNLKRFYLYGLGIGLSFPLINYLHRFFSIHQIFVWLIIVPSGIIILYGTFLLKQYLSLHPLDLSILKSDQKPTILKVKREVEATFYQDGLKDFEYGFYLLFFGCLRYLGQSNWQFIVYFWLYIIFHFLCSKIDLISSRLGNVIMKLPKEKDQNTEKEHLKFVLNISFLIFCIFVIFYFDFSRFSLGSFAKYFDNLAVMFYCLSIILVLVAREYKIARFYIYAIFYAISFPIYFFLLQYFSKSVSILISYGLPSIIIISIGVSVMIRFFKKYPVLKQNET